LDEKRGEENLERYKAGLFWKSRVVCKPIWKARWYVPGHQSKRYFAHPQLEEA
jgi:hypothetical protein